ncbi:unnamed protein product, partial [Phaeothamnion confervicola]
MGRLCGEAGLSVHGANGGCVGVGGRHGLPRALHGGFPPAAGGLLGRHVQASRHPLQRRAHARRHARRPGTGPAVVSGRASYGQLLGGERHHRLQRPSLAPHDRPPRPGQPVGASDGGPPEAGGDQAVGLGLPADARERRAVRTARPARERRRGARPFPR